METNISVENYRHFVENKIEFLKERIKKIEEIIANIQKEYEKDLEKYKKSFWLKRKFTEEPFINNFLLVSYESEKEEHEKNKEEAKKLMNKLNKMSNTEVIKIAKKEIQKYEITPNILKEI